MNKYIHLNGVRVAVAPYTERRRTMLEALNAEIDEYAKGAPEWDAIGTDVKASFWRRKAEILWLTELDADVYASDDFEQEMLMETERFFLRRRAKRSKGRSLRSERPTTTRARGCLAARSGYGSTPSARTSTSRSYLLDSIPSEPCRYGISPPISSQRQL